MENSMRGELAPGLRAAYVYAGNAIFTIRSKKTNARYTFKVVPSVYTSQQHDTSHFVRLLCGPDNESDYRYMGLILDKKTFKTTAKSAVKIDAPSAVAFAWFARNIESPIVEVWHEGRCGRCGRKLTVPESIASGIGPVCKGA